MGETFQVTLRMGSVIHIIFQPTFTEYDDDSNDNNTDDNDDNDDSEEDDF